MLLSWTNAAVLICTPLVILGESMRFMSTSKVEAGGCIELLIKRVTRWTFSSQLDEMQQQQSDSSGLGRGEILFSAPPS